MKYTTTNTGRHRRGTIVVLAAVMMMVLVGMVAFAVDYGYLLKLRADLQRAADAAALAAVRDLIRKPNGTQDLYQTRETARAYIRSNLEDDSFQVPDADIQIGRYDPSTIYSQVDLLNDGTFDAVRVTLRRDGAANSAAPLFFARALGRNQATVTATSTAVLQKAQVMEPGAAVLPFAVPISLWNDLDPGETWNGYGDGKIKDEYGNEIPGDWGTVDIGSTSNSSDDIGDQIVDGLRQDDLDDLHGAGRIPNADHIDSSIPAWMQADSGLSTGLKHAVEAVHGMQRIIPIYDQMGGSPNGNNLEFHVSGWGVVTVVDSNWGGSMNTHVTLSKTHLFNGELSPNGTLSGTSGYIDGAYTSPVLVE